ncbi:MAG: Digeranylgeranylglycerophospholipid reductase [Candidatus Heimdallarchaeota archaeon AB_125]|nr:MAG: Digeranylgeranylglycerophospholipid reductase [Candidatus Heimdallarchaeota archaeon AB_125]
MSKKKQKEKPTDVIIVGAGIAGCVLAFHLSNARFKVKVFEKSERKDLGHDWCDSVEKKAFAYASIPPPKGKEKKKEVDHLVILSPNFNKVIHLDYYDYWIVDRKLYHERLVTMAEKAGAEFNFGVEIVEPMGRGQWVVGVKTNSDKIENARIVIDCSGKERILARNIEILDLNLELKKKDKVKAYRELHEVIEGDINWENIPVEKNLLYYRYGYEKGYSRLNFEDDNHLDIGAGVGKGYSDRSPKAIVNDFVNSKKNVDNKILRGGGGDIILRRPTTMVWYGFLAVGEAACQVVPTNGCGVGPAMIGAKIAAEVVADSLRRKEVSIDSLWKYQVRFMEERGRDHAALDMLRRQVLTFNEEEYSFLIEKGILSKQDFKNVIHAKYYKIGLWKMFLSAFKGIRRIKLMLKMSKVASRTNRIYKHYKKMPKEYESRKYLSWLLGHMSLFEEIEKES